MTLAGGPAGEQVEGGWVSRLSDRDQPQSYLAPGVRSREKAETHTC
jgi:hypothetical protein